MRPSNLKTKIFLDSGCPSETAEILKLLGFLDGQTTNPTLIAKNPDVKKRLEQGKKFSKNEIFDFYKEVVTEISNLIPNGSVSVEVYSDAETQAQEMFEQGREMFSWIPNAHIKLPLTKEGLSAAAKCLENGIRVNVTLCFTQEQAAAVNDLARNTKRGDVLISPFVGRLDDISENGMDLISNVLKMYKKNGSNVEVIAASVRNIQQFMYSLKLGTDIITAPFSILKEWAQNGLPMPKNDMAYNASNLKPIPYKEFDLAKSWREFDIENELTNRGIEKFSKDWNSLTL